MSPSLAIVLATCNGSSFIFPQLWSILSQMDTIDQVIISDDNSDDNTRDIIEELFSSFSHLPNKFLVVNPRRLGPRNNFQIGLSYVRSDFVVLSDQDDIWFPNRLELIRQCAVNYDLISCNSYLYSPPNSLTGDAFAYCMPSKSFFRNIIKPSYIGCHLAFHSKYLPLLLPFPCFAYMHDMVVGILFILFSRNSIILKVPTMLFRRHSLNFTPIRTSLFFKAKTRVLYLLTFVVMYLRSK